jgi:hypothetical protein
MKIAAVLIVIAGIMPVLPRQGPDPGTATPAADLVPDIAQQAMLIEENSRSHAVKRYSGSVSWNLRKVSYLPGQPAVAAAHAEIEIPARDMRVSWELMRNADPSLPVTHTIEIEFHPPASVVIANVPGLLFAPSKGARGKPLFGLAIKVITNFFMVGLSAEQTEVPHNMRLLTGQDWIDVPFVYADGSRAILRFGEGANGHRILSEAVAKLDK